MPKDKLTNVTRVQVDLAPKAMSDLKSLKEDLEATSYAETVRRAAKFMLKVSTKMKGGAKFYFKEKDGTMAEVIF